MNAANANTATETTGTGDRTPYVGRFAPSPTGDLHIGSLLAAVGSFLDARHRGGLWLLRMEDLDTPRIVPGSADRILRTLDAFGLHWDANVIYQSQRDELYRAALHELKLGDLTFECSCTRRELASQDDTGYPGTCRSGPTRGGVPTATRLRVADDSVVFFDDRVQGKCQFALHELGDFIVRRKDDLIAYQLAVVVDDDAQHVSDVVRGADLLASTAWQIALQRGLAMRSPSYAHLPLVVADNAEKLGKSRHSVPVDPGCANTYLTTVLRLLNHPPPPELENDTPARLLAWAAGTWSVKAFERLRSVTACDISYAK